MFNERIRKITKNLRSPPTSASTRAPARSHKAAYLTRQMSGQADPTRYMGRTTRRDTSCGRPTPALPIAAGALDREGVDGSIQG